MKKTLMMIIALACVTLVFVSGLIILTNKKVDVSSLGKGFYAEIKKINEYNGITTLLVEGREENDINHRGKFTFNVNNTEIFWDGTVVDASYLKLGQIISIVSYGAVQETYPAGLTNVKKIVILDSEI